jgi:hypothetical protein
MRPLQRRDRTRHWLPNEEVEDSREHGPVSLAGPFARRATTLALALESFTIVDRSWSVKRVRRHQRRCGNGWSSG